MNLKLLVFLLLISVGNLGQAAKPSSVAVLPKLPNTIGGSKCWLVFHLNNSLYTANRHSNRSANNREKCPCIS
jgi:hypothetical protein